jgi:hypothetical protein
MKKKVVYKKIFLFSTFDIMPKAKNEPKKIASPKKITASSTKKTAPSKKPTVPIKPTTKASRNIPNVVRIFFGCSLLLFCIAVYQAFLRPNPTNFSRESLREPSLAEPETPTTETDIPAEEILVSDDVDEWSPS